MTPEHARLAAALIAMAIDRQKAEATLSEPEITELWPELILFADGRSPQEKMTATRALQVIDATRKRVNQ